jgi:hypothetical protein
VQVRRRELFTTIRTEGAILPPDLLQRVAAGDKDLGGLKPTDYHLIEGEPLNEAIVRSWNRLVGAWAAFTEARDKLPEGDLGTTVTRERWLLILFDELGYGRLQPARAAEIEGKSYAVSHAWGEHVPIHLVGSNVPLDRRSQGVAGAAAMSPHGLVQELLNRSDERLWGFVSNGLTLRVLRDNSSLTRQAYVEFDLASMMDGDVYADFVVLWLVCHQSRVEGNAPHECWLERWSQEAVKQGTRALDGLRAGVEAAISALGSGFLSHPANSDLRDALRSGELDKQDYYRELLRLVYRLLFLFVTEDRGLLLDPDATHEAAERYHRFYSTQRLRRLAERRRGSKHSDLYQGLRLVMERLGDDDGCSALGLPALGSYLWSAGATPSLATAELPNTALLDAVRALASLEERGVRRGVDYRNLGAEELGSVYESLLELHPDVNVDVGTFALTTAAGNERKTTGSYYTPTSLISCLLDSALDSVLDEAAAKGEEAILELKVCDPACGSGHFVVAAAHRIAKRLAAVRTGDDEPAPEATRTALRDVVGRCLYGVDTNPMAVELCKVSLWMEAIEPGKPLSFLDAHIKCGNSLLGTTMRLIDDGIPDDAYKTIAGDVAAVASDWKHQNRSEREGQLTLEDLAVDLVSHLRPEAEELEAAGDETVEDLHRKERQYAKLAASEDFARAKLVADAWCAAFVQHKAATGPRITTGVIRRVASGHGASEVTVETVKRLATQYGFFHWEIEFPQVFDGDEGGFDLVIGNPPWERVKLQEKEFFATRQPEIASAQNAATRRRMIQALADDDPVLYLEFQEALRRAEGESHLVRNSGRYPLAGRGDVNTYALFAEAMRGLIAPTGGVGCIVPSGIATDDTTKFLFRDLVDKKSLASLFEFENEGFFPAAGQGHMNRFCLLTLVGRRVPGSEITFLFQGKDISELSDPDRTFVLAADDFALLNPNTRTCPIFRTRRDAELTKRIYQRVSVLVDEARGDDGNPWGLKFMAMIHMSNDSGLFRTRGELGAEGFRLDGNVFRNAEVAYLPLYEAKMIYQFDHRHGDYGMLAAQERAHRLPEVQVERLDDPFYVPLPFYWVPEAAVLENLRDSWDRDWLVGWREVTDSRASARTVITAVIPRVAVSNKYLLMLPRRPEHGALLLAMLDAFVFDYAARQKLGGTSLNYFVIRQLPALSPSMLEERLAWAGATASEWIVPRILELTYAAWDLELFGSDLGYTGPPFRWDPERRALIRAELDAAFFHLYGLGEEDVDYVMETFPIVKRRDEQTFGHYRTKALILDVYRKMADAIATGVPYETILDPPPADPRVAHRSGRSAEQVPSG